MTETPTLYRKTALIQTTQWHKHGDHPEVSPLSGMAEMALKLEHDDPDFDTSAYGFIRTLEGGHVVTPGDWIAGPGARGEFWPIKPDVFAATYERF